MLADHDWTPELAAERLVEAFRLLPGRGRLFSGCRQFFWRAGAWKGWRVEGLAIIGSAQDCLGRRSIECQQLLTWARVISRWRHRSCMVGGMDMITAKREEAKRLLHELASSGTCTDYIDVQTAAKGRGLDREVANLLVRPDIRATVNAACAKARKEQGSNAPRS